MQAQFKSERSSLPAMCFMPSVAFHESTKPSVPVLKRVIQLAKEALNYLETNNSESIKVRWTFRRTIVSMIEICLVSLSTKSHIV